MERGARQHSGGAVPTLPLPTSRSMIWITRPEDCPSCPLFTVRQDLWRYRNLCRGVPIIGGGAIPAPKGKKAPPPPLAPPPVGGRGPRTPPQKPAPPQGPRPPRLDPPLRPRTRG